MKFDSDKFDEASQDKISKLVLSRLKTSAKYKNEVPIFQNLSFNSLAERAAKQYRKQYTPAEAEKIRLAFNLDCAPTRYHGLVQIKTNATRAWKRDLVINNQDNMITTFPTPEPELDEESIQIIKEGVKSKLLDKMKDAGQIDTSLLVNKDGSISTEAAQFLQYNAKILKKEEVSRINALAMESADKAKTRLVDTLMQGNFRQAYGTFTHEQVLYGMGFMRFPEYRKVQTIKHSGKKVIPAFEIRPFFRNPTVFSMFPSSDGSNLLDCSSVIEVTDISKMELISLHGQKGYNSDNIKKILGKFETFGCRNWIGIDVGDDTTYTSDYWGLDEVIPMVIHEGFLSGKELDELGITGITSTEYVNAHIIVVGGLVIRANLLKAPMGYERSYFGVPFNRFGSNIWDVLGIGSMLWDTEQRINKILAIYEDNLDWAARPAILSDRDAFEEEADASNILPGQIYQVNRDLAGTRLPDPVRIISKSSAQYHLIFTQVSQLLRLADEECGIPAFAYGAQDFGKSSLGEYAQRMSNALRTIKDAALEEDIWLIEPAFELMFSRIMQEDPELAVGQDVKMEVRGITGLLNQDLEKKSKMESLGMIMNLGNQVPPQVTQYAIRQYLTEQGIPVEALGMDDPQIDMAIAAAASNQLKSGAAEASQAAENMATSQAPTIDGRSGGVPRGAVAEPNGSVEY